MLCNQKRAQPKKCWGPWTWAIQTCDCETLLQGTAGGNLCCGTLWTPFQPLVQHWMSPPWQMHVNVQPPSHRNWVHRCSIIMHYGISHILKHHQWYKPLGFGSFDWHAAHAKELLVTSSFGGQTRCQTCQDSLFVFCIMMFLFLVRICSSTANTRTVTPCGCQWSLSSSSSSSSSKSQSVVV